LARRSTEIGDLASATTSRVSRACICCDGQDRISLYQNRIVPIAGLDLSYAVVKCGSCGAVFADSVAAPADYASYYRSCSKYDAIAAVSDVPPVDRRRAEFAVTFVGQHACDKRSVLDLGCGSGILLAQFLRAGWHDAQGTDPAPNAPTSARRLFGLDGVRQGTIDAVRDQFALADFDLICVTAVLEHLAAPGDTLRSIASGMRADACLLIEVPALERFSRTPLEPYGEFSIEHINFFSRRSLTEIARRSGLRPVASALLDLWPAATDSLYVLFEKGPAEHARPDDGELMRDYLALSAIELRPVLERAGNAIRSGGAVIWGAGSHSARLLPALERMGIDGDVHAVIDSNPNLHGRSFGRHVVMPPDALRDWPDATVIVSSFRASAAIARGLQAKFSNPVCELYSAPRDRS
jgi:SAM-dependent methyltransferase